MGLGHQLSPRVVQNFIFLANEIKCNQSIHNLRRILNDYFEDRGPLVSYPCCSLTYLMIIYPKSRCSKWAKPQYSTKLDIYVNFKMIDLKFSLSFTSTRDSHVSHAVSILRTLFHMFFISLTATIPVYCQKMGDICRGHTLFLHKLFPTSTRSDH